MCEIKRVKVGDNEYSFYNRSESTRNGFKHITQLFKNDVLIASDTAHYLNRTWERYRYQTVMKNCVNTMRDRIKDNLKESVKNELGIKRMTEKGKYQLAMRIATDSKINELNSLYNELD